MSCRAIAVKDYLLWFYLLRKITPGYIFSPTDGPQRQAATDPGSTDLMARRQRGKARDGKGWDGMRRDGPHDPAAREKTT